MFDLSFLKNFDINEEEIVDVSAKYNKKESSIKYSVVLKKAFNLKKYQNLYKAFFNFSTNLKLEIKSFLLKYENEVLQDIEFLEYFDFILEELSSLKPRYNAFKKYNKEYNDHKILIFVEEDLIGLDDLTIHIEEKFLNYGLHINIEFVKEKGKSIKDELEKLSFERQEMVRKINEESNQLKLKNEKLKESYYKNPTQGTKILIKDIPSNSHDLSLYTNEVGLPVFEFEGVCFFKEIRTLKTSTLCTLKITDQTDSIVVKKWLRKDAEIGIINDLKDDDLIKITGKAEYDLYLKNIVINATEIKLVGKEKKEEVVDLQKEKRVELHAHSKMSTLDGLANATDILKFAKELGHKACAITDHNGCYSYPDIFHDINKIGIKPIYGLESNYINDDNFIIAFPSTNDVRLCDATYVVFDLETTGLRVSHDKIIEIACIKCNINGEIDRFEMFVNPQIPIPKKITEITSITDNDVSDAKTIDEIFPDFVKFIDGCILVAHNAHFDYNVIVQTGKKLGYDLSNIMCIDTLNLFRTLHFDQLKRFNLKELAKFYKVKQEQHHRAIDDTRVLKECFIEMYKELINNNVKTYSDINKVLIKDDFYKTQFTSHINLLVKNQVGLKNLYKLLSDSLTDSCYIEPRLKKSVLNKYKEGILISSGCVNNEVFQEALYGTDEKLKEYIKYYDFIEVQPPSGYRQFYKEFDNGKEIVLETIKKIIKFAKEANKLVCATSDCHYIHKEDHNYRNILINSLQIGGGFHPLSKYEEYPLMHFRTTDEMLDEFSFLDKDLAYEIVVTNTNIIADMIEDVQIFKKDMFAPSDDEFKDSLNIPSIEEEVKKIVNHNKELLYGNNPHMIVEARINKELNSIISNGYASVYYMSHLLVTKSLSDGYLVGSRGSVGSSLVATLMRITEINPLSPHYRCPKCKFQVFKMTLDEKNEYGIKPLEEPFIKLLDNVESGYDLPDMTCPCCNTKLKKDGHDIPFETFLGFNGDKIPDIDLNFSGDYQSKAHEFVRDFMGENNAFRSGTVQTIAENYAFGYVKGYAERINVEYRQAELERLATKLVGIKRSTGQHPGGIIVVPKRIDIFDVTPIQYPADNIESDWKTTHYDYHSFENNLLKLDILGHDDPTMIKYLMDYVLEHKSEFPFDKAEDIPVDDEKVYKLFNQTEVIGINKDDLGSNVASFAVPEFGTNFVRGLLADTMPKTFSELVKISGLSHGTGVWINNSQDLVLNKTEYGKIEFADVIGCRDDIMVYLMYQNLEPIKAFEIMEFVRRGKAKTDKEKWQKYKEYMESKKVPSWYIWSCEQIEYMFPKAHATAYVVMALRIAWFKVYSPKLFYSAWFTNRAKAFSVTTFLQGKVGIKLKISELENKKDAKVKDEDLLNTLYVALEMVLRGIKFLPISITKSEAYTFKIEEDGLRIPFIALDGLGKTLAFDLVQKRNEKPFTSKKDIKNRTSINQTIFQEFENLHVFENLPDEEVEENVGLFAN